MYERVDEVSFGIAGYNSDPAGSARPSGLATLTPSLSLSCLTGWTAFNSRFPYPRAYLLCKVQTSNPNTRVPRFHTDTVPDPHQHLHRDQFLFHHLGVRMFHASDYGNRSTDNLSSKFWLEDVTRFYCQVRTARPPPQYSHTVLINLPVQ